MSIFNKIARLVPVIMLTTLAACAADVRADLTDARYTWQQVGHPAKSIRVRVLDKDAAAISEGAQASNK